MKYLDQAFLAIAEAERRLRDLIGQAASDSSYREIPAIADLAKALSILRAPIVDNEAAADAEGVDGGEKDQLSNPNALDETAPSALHGLRARQPSEREFPRFEIDANRLVKLGWSSRDKRVYEHRVNHDLVIEICNKLQEKVGARKPFKMEAFFPMRSEQGDEIPSYQAYLVLKWLQQFDVVERKGKDGYVFKNRSFAADVVADLWAKTAQRG